MAKDLIIGSVFGYDWSTIQYWVNSIQKTDFKGDIVLVGSNLKRETLEEIVGRSVFIKCYGKQDEDGNIVSDSKMAPHVERFFYIWDALKEMDPTEYRYVVATDVKDVIFQSDPFPYIESKTTLYYSMIASGEGMLYENEPWGNKNYLDCFGPYFHEMMKKKMICNVGVFGGFFADVQNMALLLFQMSLNRPVKIVDQAVYNFLVHMTENVNTYISNNDDAWAIQLGTTRYAVESGSGDLGQAYKNNVDEYEMLYEYEQPIIENGIVYNSKKEKFAIVHQYDRIPDLKQNIMNMYGEPDYVESNGPGIFSYKTS